MRILAQRMRLWPTHNSGMNRSVQLANREVTPLAGHTFAIRVLTSWEQVTRKLSLRADLTGTRPT